MKKNFLTIYFSIFLGIVMSANASIYPITGTGERPQMPERQTNIDPNANMPDPNNQEEVKEFFKKRLENAPLTLKDQDTDWNNATGVSVIHTPEYYKNQQEQKKTLFEKMYDKAISALHDKDTQQQSEMSEQGKLEKQLAETATRFFTLAEEDSKNVQPDVPTVAISLPSGRKILAPAREHIPYFLSYIDIQSNGYVKIEDTIIIVANNQKFANGLQRVFNKNYGRRKLDFILENVTVNNTKVPYTLEEMGNNIILKPKYNQKLASGIYTYKFNYVVNNLLVAEKDQVFFDWNIVGTPLNTLITSANAIVTIPMGHSFDAVQSVVGKERLYTDRRTNVIPLENYAVAFSNTTPMFNGEDMLILVNMNKNIFMKDFDKNLNTFLLNWGNAVYSGLGFLAILISFVLSLITLKYDRKNNKYTPSYDGSLMRHIQIGKFDRVAFVAQILNLFRKNALDIVIEENRIYLKLKSELAKLSGFEHKAIKYLFPKKQIITEVNNSNTLLFKKSKKIFEKHKKYRIR